MHSEEALYGHLILSMIAATINVYIQNRTKQIYDDRDAIFMTLRNQKCSVRKNGVSTMEPQRQANLYYDKFGIECPLMLKSKDGILEPQLHLLQSRHSDM